MVETPRFAFGGANAGGFLPSGIASLPSPAPSTASSRAAAHLPHPRSKPLARGSRKEDYARNYVSDRLMHVSRRYVKKHGIPDPADEVTGYNSMDELCKDLEEVVDVLWFSGTPSLQIPYLLNIALEFNTYLPSFAPSPRPTFALLKKLDHCFASLLVGRDVKSGDPLPGFQGNARGFTRTDMVRCKSLADETRMIVAMIMSDEPDVENFIDDDYKRAPRSPPRRNVSVSFSEGLIQSPVPDNDDVDNTDDEADEMKFEDVVDGEQLDSDDMDDGKDPIRGTAKRKSATTDFNDEDQEEFKRIKIEDEPGPNFRDGLPGDADLGAEMDPLGVNSADGKFHFIADVDSDSDDETPANTITTTTAINAIPPSTTPLVPDTEQDMGEPHDEVDEDEEELQLNVGKVYEKTLVQLGRSLGESITDG
ncbi:hypothetical protein M426DRAFT_322384 [Hypoxylon sp. CI-4A]|nr:hypothetical protein M426DRAFT_322384 [Hypoxylon sp. CI-4A]